MTLLVQQTTSQFDYLLMIPLLLHVAKCLDMLIQRVKLDLPNVYNLLCANKLALNLSKSNHIIFNLDRN